MSETYETQDAPVFSYTLTSADMRHSGVGERDVYLREDPKVGLLFQGEISGCGSGCFIDLSQILLEYAMSCEGCGEDGIALKEAYRFGDRLGEILAAKINLDNAEVSASVKVAIAIKVTLNSMGATYKESVQQEHFGYSLDCCPLSECGKSTGLGGSIGVAKISFVALCKSLVNQLSPGWRLLEPVEADGKMSIHKVVIGK